MSADDAVVLSLRVVVIVLLYLFLITVAILTYRQLGARPARVVGRAAHFVVLESGTAGLMPGTSIALEPVTRVGRASENTIVVDDTFVSAAHAVVLERGGAWWVRDEGSTNGTFVNGKMVDGDLRLRAGDELQIGQARFKLVG